MSFKKSLSLISILLCLNTLANIVHATSYVPIPNTVKEYTDTSNIIVIGKIGAIQKIHKFYGYQKNASELAKLDTTSQLSLALPMVDYEVNIEEIIKDDALFPVNIKKKPLILRVVLNHDTILNAKNAQENQGRFILFLARNPDNETYGFYSFAHKVRLDNRGARYSFEDKEYDVLDGSINSDNFVKAIKEKSVK